MTINQFKVKNLFLSGTLCLSIGLSLVSCSDDDTTVTYPVVIAPVYPAELPSVYNVESGSITYKDLNNGRTYTFELPLGEADMIPAGTYDIDGIMVVNYTDDEGVKVSKTLRAVASQQVISSTAQTASLKWFFYNPTNTLVFGEIYFAGSPNAAGTNGLYDSYFTIYNNTDEVQYADGIAIVESKMLNTDANVIVTPANQRETNFTVQTVYVIPGNGHDVAIAPGESIKIVDQAIDWNAQVVGALDHRDADFEWYDELTSASVKDTDNPEVPNLDKWYSYSPTIWITSNQCNRSYALVRFPEDMTAEKYLAEYDGTYTYISSVTQKEMTGSKCYLIKYDWIIDGVNLCPDESWIQGALSTSVDASHAAVSTAKLDKNRFGKKFVRKVAGVSVAGNTVLMDTNDSAQDFEVVSVKQ